MEFALITVQKIAGLFIILLIGVLAYRLRILDNDSSRHLTDLLLKVVQPCTLFMSYQTDFDSESLIGLGITAALAAFSFLFIILIVTILIPEKEDKDTAVERTTAVFSNCGFIGLPLVNAVVGSEGVFYLTAYLTMYHIFFWTYAYNMLNGAGNLRTTLRNIIQPCTVAIFAGLICFILRIRLPQIIAEPIDTVGSLNTALAMIISGCTLAGSEIMDTLKHLRPYYISFIKLILLPAVMILIFRFIPLPWIIRATVIISIACPAGTLGTMVAVQSGRNGNYSSLLFTLTTLLSLITIPCMMFFMTMVM